jgi:hypothetical protein
VTFRHRAGVSPYTSSFDFAETCVFGKQSLGPFHCGPLGLDGVNPRHPTGASLLPKLRDHFAEFLNEGSSDRLGILYLPTCVGFGTGTSHLPRRFSRRHGFRNFALFRARRPVSGSMAGGFAYRPPYTLTPGQPSPGLDYLPASPHRLPTASLVRAVPPGRSPEGEQTRLHGA